MSDQIQRRGGTTAQHSTFTGALRELTVDTDKKVVVVHDGATVGGFPLLRQELNNLPASVFTSAPLGTGLQNGAYGYAVDTGVANTYQVAYSPAITALTDGMVLKFKAKTANTGASTFNPNGLGALPIWNFNHVALQGGEIVANGDVWVQWNSSLNGGSGACVLLESTGGNQISGRLINVQAFTASGTYTPTPGMSTAIVEVQGGGGGGGGSVATSASQWSSCSGGAAGSYGKGRFTAAQIGASVAVTIGAGGAGNVGASGGGGGTSSFGALISAPGGAGGNTGFLVTNGTSAVASGPAPGSPATGGNLINASGQTGLPGLSGSNGVVGGMGAGSAVAGGSGGGMAAGAGNAGGAAIAYGAGGGGACGNVSNGAFAGGAGKAGVVIVWEFA